MRREDVGDQRAAAGLPEGGDVVAERGGVVGRDETGEGDLDADDVEHDIPALRPENEAEGRRGASDEDPAGVGVPEHGEYQLPPERPAEEVE